MKGKKVDHIGIAVKSIEEKINIYKDFLGFDEIEIEELKDRGLRVAMIKVGETRIELLESTSDYSTIKKYLEKKGEGIHHIAYEVDNFDKIELLAEKENIKLLGKPAIGAGGSQVVFLHPKTTGGVLIELVLRRKENDE
ncbi:MAG: methylmalonyl-CoA/ethylmalonyl-CoA epimerase [Kosmotogales bacterium]|nr:methylmalonyl-CoA/ethylmalonyl-CoA epimerase [Kosmotogales bacterium]